MPTIEEWQELIEDVGGEETEEWERIEYDYTYVYKYAGTKLKSSTGWINGNGDGELDFDAFPAGFMRYWGDDSYDIGETTSFWSSTVDGSGSPFLTCILDKTSYIDIYQSSNMVSIRLIKD